MADDLGELDGPQLGNVARRAEAQRQMIFAHKGARVTFMLALADTIVSMIFAILPDSRASGTLNYSSRFGGIMVAQTIFSWLTAITSIAVVMLVWIIFSVPPERLTFERKANLWYVVTAKTAQTLVDIALLGYPTPMRQLIIFFGVSLRIGQIFWNLRIIRQSREAFSRRIRPPLVIKALLDMKGDAITTADPLTMGMLERLEGIVKVRDQLKFNVKHGRQNLTLVALMLLVFSGLSFSWELTKLLTYQSRHFSKEHLTAIEDNSHLPMYWPSRAHSPATHAAGAEWELNVGSAVECDDCELPRTFANARLKPIPNRGTRVVLVVVGGLSAQPEYTDFLRFRSMPNWEADAVELTMRVQLPTNAVPNWLATVTGLTPDLIGALGNRNVGSTAFDNIFRTMKKFEDNWWCEQAGRDCGTATKREYQAAMAAEPWFTGLVKKDLPYLHGDGGVSTVANEDDSLDTSEIFKSESKEQDANRASVAHLALGDAERPYHFFLLHYTDVDSQAVSHGKSDTWNRANLGNASSTSEAAWPEYQPLDTEGASWQANSYKRAIARIGDSISTLIDAHGDDDTTFLIMGDHGHVNPGGAGGASDDVRLVPFFAYKRNSKMGETLVQSQRDAGSAPSYDATRFVAKARLLAEYSDPPHTTANDFCDIMGESMGDHVNTCDEWRKNGDHQVENVDIAPTVMALLGLPVPRHATGVFIDDVVGPITMSDASAAQIGLNCTAQDEAAEAGQGISQDRMCTASYGAGENAATYAALNSWGSTEMAQWRHVIHYRDLYQQKLAYVREFLVSEGKLGYWEGEDLAFLKTTADGAQYYDEGASGRCAAYDPFNAVDASGTTATNAHKYTVLPLEFGLCGGCNKKFITGEELTILDYVVCNQNDWNKVKQYYIQGIKGLMVVYNREIATQKAQKATRNHLMTLAPLLIIGAIMVFVTSSSTLADPMQLVTKRNGEEYLRSYYTRTDVRAVMWAVALSALYYTTAILFYYLLQNLLGFVVWDASLIFSPGRTRDWALICVCPSYFFARVVRGLYMWHYRYIVDKLDEEEHSTPLLLSPVRLWRLFLTFFSGDARTVDIGTVYLIRIYMVLLSAAVLIIIQVLHCSYSFLIPFIYRIVYIDEVNWTMRFQVVTVQLIAFPLWIDSWWCLHRFSDMLVDGVSVSQLYEMRSEKEERRAGGFPPEDELLSAALPPDAPGGGGGGAPGGRGCVHGRQADAQPTSLEQHRSLAALLGGGWRVVVVVVVVARPPPPEGAAGAALLAPAPLGRGGLHVVQPPQQRGDAPRVARELRGGAHRRDQLREAVDHRDRERRAARDDEGELADGALVVHAAAERDAHRDVVDDRAEVLEEERGEVEQRLPRDEPPPQREQRAEARAERGAFGRAVAAQRRRLARLQLQGRRRGISTYREGQKHLKGGA